MIFKYKHFLAFQNILPFMGPTKYDNHVIQRASGLGHPYSDVAPRQRRIENWDLIVYWGPHSLLSLKPGTQLKVNIGTCDCASIFIICKHIEIGM